jgi:uncharacterized membrane protein YdjX (TVP38/TMEM64 family)
MFRFLPLIVVGLFMLLAYLFGVADYLTYEQLKENRNSLQMIVEENPVLGPLGYIGLYIAVVALSIPGALILSIAGGFLFSQPWSMIYVMVGATIGACMIFLIARGVLRDFFQARAGGIIDRMREGFRSDATSYLLFLRFVPLFPFWAVNVVPAFFGISLFTFAWATVVGIAPGAFVFTQAGAGLGAIFDSGAEFSLANIFNLQIRIALIALGFFALLPAIIKKLKNR